MLLAHFEYTWRYKYVFLKQFIVLEVIITSYIQLHTYISYLILYFVSYLTWYDYTILRSVESALSAFFYCWGVINITMIKGFIMINVIFTIPIVILSTF